MIKIFKMFRSLPFALVMMMSLFSPTLSASLFDTWPEIPSPPESKVAWVGDNMMQNGVPMKIKNFSSKLDPQSVIKFYKSAWKNSGERKPEENKLGEWLIIGLLDGDYLLTVQAKKNDTGSEGFLSVSTLPKAVVDKSIHVDDEFPRLSGTKVMSDTGSIDSGRVGNTLILKNNYTVSSNTSFYKSKMQSQGWTLDPVANEVNKSAVHDAYLYFTRDNMACIITINRLKKEIGSSIIVNISNTSV